MTDIAMRDAANGHALTLPTPERRTPAPATIADWERELLAAGSIAAKLCDTPFVPEHFRGKVAEAAAAILTGRELNLPPMSALRSIFVIKGTPGMYAKTMVAIVQAQGHQVWIESQSPVSVTVCGQRNGSEHVHRVTWDLDRVKQADLGSNPMYRKNPQAMMVARGQAEICRQIAADALAGIPYAVEEIEDFDDRPLRAEIVPQPKVTAAEILGRPEPEPTPLPEAEPVRPAEPTLADRAAKAIATFSARGIPQAQMELKLGRPAARWDTEDIAALMIAYQAVQRGEEFDPRPQRDAAEAEEVPAGDEPMSARQQARMFALFADVALADADAQRAYMSEILGRDVESRSSLTATEADRMLAALEAWKRQSEPPAEGE